MDHWRHRLFLISPASFSCRNLFPAVFGMSGNVTLLAKTQGWNAAPCVPFHGAEYTLPDRRPVRMSWFGEGSCNDVDTGIVSGLIAESLQAPGFADREPSVWSSYRTHQPPIPLSEPPREAVPAVIIVNCVPYHKNRNHAKRPIASFRPEVPGRCGKAQAGVSTWAGEMY